MEKEYYEDRSLQYGIAHTRLRKILELTRDGHFKRVLDVGCARGYLGARLKKPDTYVAGIEISEKAAAEARTVLDKVYSFDVQREWPAEIVSEGKFDLVVMAEVIEHCFDPVILLKNVNNILRNGGVLIVTTPNIMTWTNRLKFLCGRFKYTDQGMLDFGHIRFFTHEYLHEVLAEAGFNVVKENNIIFPGKLTALLQRWPSLFAQQFIFKSIKV